MIGRLIAPTSVRIAAARAGARRLLDGAPQRDHAEIHQEQHEHRRQPRVPAPRYGSPHIGLPHSEPVAQAEEREGRADRRQRPWRRHRRADAARPACRARQRSSSRPAEHGEPGGGHVDEHDLDGRALLVVVGRAHTPETSPIAKATAVAAASHGRARFAKARNRVGLARSIRAIGVSSVARMRGCAMCCRLICSRKLAGRSFGVPKRQRRQRQRPDHERW